MFFCVFIFILFWAYKCFALWFRGAGVPFRGRGQRSQRKLANGVGSRLCTSAQQLPYMYIGSFLCVQSGEADLSYEYSNNRDRSGFA